MIDYKKYKAPESVVRQNPNGLRRPRNIRADWMAIVSFLNDCNDIRKSVCVSCFGAKLYDKNNIEYQINGTMSLQKAKDIVEQIRKINDGSK